MSQYPVVYSPQAMQSQWVQSLLVGVVTFYIIIVMVSELVKGIKGTT